MMMLDTEDQGELNLLVVQYLGQIDTKLRDRFCKAANIQPGQSSSLTLEGVVQSYLESKNSKSLKRKSLTEGEKEEVTEKKQKLEKKESGDKADSKKKKEERKTVFIRNITKKFNFEKHRGRFESFGKILGFKNSGKGFGFLTFVSEEDALTCIETLNSTEIDGRTIQMNIARGNQGKENEEEKTGCKLFVHGVKQEATAQEISEEFSKFGSVTDCFNPGKGFAFVTYQTKEQAEAAVEGLQGRELFGSVLSLNISKPKEKPEGKKDSKKNKKKKKENIAEESRLFVKNIGKDADTEELRKIFSAHGAVKDLYNPGKGFLFVSYSNKEEADNAAKALDGEDVNGQKIECNIAKFKKGLKKKKK